MPPPVATSTGMLPSKGTVLVDFTARWCGPCRALKPVLDSVAAEYAGRVTLAVVDVDDDPAIAEQFSVRSMPTCVVLRDGREVGRFVGSRPRAFVVGVLDRVLDGDVAVTAP
jgi:thioredoxin 1